MKHLFRIYLLLGLLIGALRAENILLLSEFKESEFKDKNLSLYVMSEKLDGVRALWDGRTLKTRKGYTIKTPKFFTRGFPPFALDGELFIARDKFNELSALINKDEPSNLLWHSVTYNVFDVPKSKQMGLLARLGELEKFINAQEAGQKTGQNLEPKGEKTAVQKDELNSTLNLNSRLKIIPQIPIINEKHLQDYYQKVLSQGGEGLVVRLESAIYESGRSDNALKLKPWSDKECKIIGYTKGKGKYENAMGAVLCEDLESKKRFKIGTGFKDEFRFNPPPLGTLITYKFNGYTKKGLPKFPVFLRVRDEK